MKPKLNSNVLTFVAVFTAVIIWNEIGPQVSSTVFLLLDAPHVFPHATIYFIVSLLPFILLFEVVAKLLFMRAIPDKVVHQQVDADAVPGFDRDVLTAYTEKLKALGFKPLMDYQIAESSTGIARLFAHSEYSCSAVVAEFIGPMPMWCSVHSSLEQNWELSITNSSKSLVSATAYAFFRQPRILGKREAGADPQRLLQSHLAFRQQMIDDLHLQVIPTVSGQAFFDLIQRDRTRLKQVLWRKSVLVGLVEMLLFSLNPKDEWLGEYAGLAARRHRN